MTVDQRLAVHNQRLTVHKHSGMLLIRGPGLPGYEHILCIEGDKRILCNAFDEYVACDVFEHYVPCRDINILEKATASSASDDIIGKEIQYIYKDVALGDPGYLQITSNNNSTVTISVNTDSSTASEVDSSVFMIGTAGNMLTFTETGTKPINIDGRIISVKVISIESAVFTIESMLKLGFPEEGIAGLDDIAGEAVFIDSIPENIIKTTVRELAGEIIFEDVVDISEGIACVTDELAAEIVFNDINAFLGAPSELVACVTDATVLDLLPPTDPVTNITYLDADGRKALLMPIYITATADDVDEIIYPSGIYPLQPPTYLQSSASELDGIIYPSGMYPLQPPTVISFIASDLEDVNYTNLLVPIITQVTLTWQKSSQDPSETLIII